MRDFNSEKEKYLRDHAIGILAIDSHTIKLNFDDFLQKLAEAGVDVIVVPPLYRPNAPIRS